MATADPSRSPLCRGLTFREAWRRLPVQLEIRGLGVRWLGPLVDVGHEAWLDDMSQAAWGYLEFCGWAELLPDEPFLVPRGEVSPGWIDGLWAAAERLARQGSGAGPEGDMERWLSWVCFAISEPRAHVRRLAER
ncbi:MAG: hypothetical protein QGG40_10810 [Myxococcota bacterium]|nr:hypothetical protein [Myxococcota bacterium]